MNTYTITLTIGPKITTVLLNSQGVKYINSHCVTDAMNIRKLVLDLILEIVNREDTL